MAGRYSRTQYSEMADIVRDILAEVKRRNSIGVNLYASHILAAELSLREIAEGEKWNFTSECGPVEK